MSKIIKDYKEQNVNKENSLKTKTKQYISKCAVNKMMMTMMLAQVPYTI